MAYFDNAATSQRPHSVIDLQQAMTVQHNANIHRAVHTLSNEATELYEKGRKAVARFIGAESENNIVFTSGTTASINLVAACFVRGGFLKQGDKVVISYAEHHSNIVPWQLACQTVGASLEVVPVEKDGTVDLQRLEAALTPEVEILAITHVSNILGVVNPIAQITEIAHAKGIPVLIDGAQGIVHRKVDVQAIGCDFYVFSGHKIYAPTGIGVLYGTEEWLEKLPPFMGGGDMVAKVTFAHTTYAEVPLKFAAGTSNITGGACMAPAVEFAQSVLENGEMAENELLLDGAMRRQLASVEGLTLAAAEAKERIPLYSFTIEGVHPFDAATLLDKMGFALRSGHMCAEPLVDSLSQTGMLRASLMPYNTLEEVERFGEALRRAVSMLR